MGSARRAVAACIVAKVHNCALFSRRMPCCYRAGRLSPVWSRTTLFVKTKPLFDAPDSARPYRNVYNCGLYRLSPSLARPAAATAAGLIGVMLILQTKPNCDIGGVDWHFRAPFSCRGRLAIYDILTMHDARVTQSQADSTSIKSGH